jgi:hypothetical protein
VGNFPQAFTHVALISSAFKLARYEEALERRALRSAEARQPVAAET